jgi:asparagine synthase (glutamine-hydrolysing)
MVQLIRHRGPDGHGLIELEYAVFAHVRLSIIDIAAGHQPMWSPAGDVVVSFNGEIFNYRELREEQRRSFDFRSESDTEVILSQYLQYGEEAFARLRGQFAFALHDCRTQVTYLVRDHLGEKPLFFFHNTQGLLFASELKAVLYGMRRYGLEPRIAEQPLVDYLSLNYVPFEQTLVEELKQVPAGTFLKIYRDSEGSIHKVDGSILRAVSTFNSQTASAHDALEVLVIASRRRSVSDVSLGILLSAGLDSSLVLALLAQQGVSCTAYTADFADKRFSEADQAEQFCARLGVPHKRILISPQAEDIQSLLQALVWHGDTPLADSSACAVYLLSREVAKDCKVVLSGDGADELFGGYLTHQATYQAQYLPQWARPLISQSLSAALKIYRTIRRGQSSPQKVGLAEKLERFARNLPLPVGAAHSAWNGTFSSAEKRLLLHPSLMSRGVMLNTFERLAVNFFLNSKTPSYNEILEFDQKFYLGGDILQKIDRMSMAHGLEVRPLYLEQEVVQFANNLPESHRMRKKIVAAVMKDICPWYRIPRKQGFSIPIHYWFRTLLVQSMEQVLHEKDSGVWDYINRDEVQRIWNLHREQRVNRGFDLWGILIFIMWYREVFAVVGTSRVSLRAAS